MSPSDLNWFAILLIVTQDSVQLCRPSFFTFFSINTYSSLRQSAFTKLTGNFSSSGNAVVQTGQNKTAERVHDTSKISTVYQNSTTTFDRIFLVGYATSEQNANWQSALRSAYLKALLTIQQTVFERKHVFINRLPNRQCTVRPTARPPPRTGNRISSCRFNSERLLLPAHTSQLFWQRVVHVTRRLSTAGAASPCWRRVVELSIRLLVYSHLSPAVHIILEMSTFVYTAV